MPVFTPARRWQPPFRPFKREPFGRRALESLELASKVRCSAAGCAATVCCKKPLSSARWSALRVRATALAAARRKSTVTSTRHGPVSGTRSTSGLSRWAARKNCWKCCRRWTGTRSAARPGVTSSIRSAKSAPASSCAACSPATLKSATIPGNRSSARCASRTGGRATPSTTRRPTPSRSLSWSDACARASSWSRPRSRRR